jgi:hypothetical protein
MKKRLLKKKALQSGGFFLMKKTGKVYQILGKQNKRVLKWARHLELKDRRVAFDQVTFDITVSTVFLGLDHSFLDEMIKVFETMVFGGKLDGLQERYSTHKQALHGHATILQKVKESLI